MTGNGCTLGAGHAAQRTTWVAAAALTGIASAGSPPAGLTTSDTWDGGGRGRGDGRGGCRGRGGGGRCFGGAVSIDTVTRGTEPSELLSNNVAMFTAADQDLSSLLWPVYLHTVNPRRC